MFNKRGVEFNKTIKGLEYKGVEYKTIKELKICQGDSKSI